MRSYPGLDTHNKQRPPRQHHLSFHTSAELAMKALVVNAWPKLKTLWYSSFGFTLTASVRGLWKNNNAIVQATNKRD